VLRTHHKHAEFAGPRFFVRNQWLEMHPMDNQERLHDLKEDNGLGYCNITKCCTEVCPVGIKITDNSIIPLKERVADEYYDPAKWLMRKIRGR
jgi:succinate dehydrogenase / fumarate reductase iron-sulfur subunit